MSTIKVNQIDSLNGTDEVQIPTLDQRMAKAWVNFNGAGVVTIRDSYNVSSVIDIGVGLYSVNFLSPMPDVNYGFVASNGSGQTTQDNTSTSSASFVSRDTVGTPIDDAQCNAVFYSLN